MTGHSSAVLKSYVRVEPVRNLLLSTLTESEFEKLRPFLEVFDLHSKTVIQQSSQPAENVYFVESGIVSRVVQTPSDGPMETVMVGRYGFVGASVVLGIEQTLRRAVVLLPGRALRISAEDLSRVMSETPSIREHLLRYISILMMTKAQMSLCNAKHDTLQRTARWMLSARDRLDTNRIAITQGALASMLGVRRTSVSSALKRFESLKLVEQERGILTIVDAEGLKPLSCECYKIIEQRYSTLKTMKQYAHRFDFS